MITLRYSWWLIARIARRRRGEGASTVVLVLGTMLLVGLALATATVPRVVHGQSARLLATAPRLDPDQSSGRASDLRMVVPVTTNTRRWEGRAVTRDFYARGTSTLTAPGVPAMPAAGEFYASPELATLIKHDSVVGALFSHQRMVGTIGPQGLTEPHQLLAIVGVDGHEQLLVKVLGFGVATAARLSGYQDRTWLDRFVACYSGAIVWLPGLCLMVIVARLSLRTRATRARALRLIGCSRVQVYGLQSAEAAAVCTPSALVAAVVFWWRMRRATVIPGTNLGFFPVDGRMPLWEYVVIIGLVVVLLGLIVAFSSVHADENLPQRSSAGPASRRRLASSGGVAFALGLLLLALPTLIRSHNPLLPLSLWAGIAFIAVGLGSAGPVMVATMLRRLDKDTSSVGRLVGVRLVAVGHVSPALRLGSAICVLVVLFLGGQSFASVFNGGDSQQWADQLAQHPLVPAQVTDLTGDLTLDEVMSSAERSAGAELSSLRIGRHQIPVVYATCADLAALSGVRSADCSSIPQWIRVGGPIVKHPTGTVKLPVGESIRLPPARDAIAIANLPASFNGALLLPRGQAPTRASRHQGSTYFLLIPHSVLLTVMARIASAAPSAQFDLGDLDWHNPDTRLYPGQTEWLSIGALAGLLLGAIALLATVLGETRDRAARFRAMRLLGASRKELASAHLWSTAAPLVIVSLLAIIGGWLVSTAMRNIDDRAVIHSALYLWTIAVAVLASGLIALATWPSVVHAAAKGGAVDA